MANPNFPNDGQGDRIEGLVDAAAGVHLKYGVGSVAVSGATNTAAWHGVASHADGATAGSTDGLVVMAGESGTTVKHVLVDSTGNQQIVGIGAVGAAAAGNPVMAGGSDGTNARYVLVDTSGRQIAVGAGASGSALVGNPVLVAGSDGTNARTFTTDTAGNLNVIAGESAHATWVASVQGVAFTAATQVLVIEAPSASKVYIRRLIIWQTGTDTTNAIINFTLIRTTTAGTGGAITPNPMDTGDGAYGGIVRSAPTAGTAGVTLFNIPLDVPNAASAVPIAILDWDNGRLGKGPIIPAGTANGIALVAPATTGGASFGASIEFSL